ncbi:FxsA family protein [Litorivicinus lipolyticus]|uniref:FxsA family protein n=1 Tax=Litorivicinus lipolyticus TaxID=418701 RepID=UPI003B5B6105
MPLLLFLVIPLVEVAILIQVGGLIGFWPTLGLVVLTAVIGAQLLKQQGRALLMAAQGRLERGELPLSELAQGLLVAVGGALLLTPGFATDAFGFACLLPGTRAAMGNALKRWLEPRLVARAQFTAQSSSARPSSNGDVLDGEFRRDD